MGNTLLSAAIVGADYGGSQICLPCSLQLPHNSDEGRPRGTAWALVRNMVYYIARNGHNYWLWHNKAVAITGISFSFGEP